MITLCGLFVDIGNFLDMKSFQDLLRTAKSSQSKTNWIKIVKNTQKFFKPLLGTFKIIRDTFCYLFSTFCIYNSCKICKKNYTLVDPLPSPSVIWWHCHGTPPPYSVTYYLNGSLSYTCLKTLSQSFLYLCSAWTSYFVELPDAEVDSNQW